MTMDFIIRGLDEKLMAILLEKLAEWQGKNSLSYPKIKGWREYDNGQAMIITFDKSDSVKMARLLTREGFAIS